MRTFTKTESGDFVIAPEGTTAAVLTGQAFLGRHESVWNGQAKVRELVGLIWELAEAGPDGRALTVTETLTASMHEKSTFFSRILALTGGREPPADFVLAKLLGRHAVVTISHSTKGDRTYANIAAVGPLPRGMTGPAPSVAPIYFDIEAPDPAAYAALPPRFRKLADTAIGTTAPAAQAPGGWNATPPPAPTYTPAPAGWQQGQAMPPASPSYPPPGQHPQQAAPAGWGYQPQANPPPAPAAPARPAPAAPTPAASAPPTAAWDDGFDENADVPF